MSARKLIRYSRTVLVLTPILKRQITINNRLKRRERLWERYKMLADIRDDQK